MNQFKKNIHEYVEKHRNEAVELFQSLIRIKSVNHGAAFDQGNEAELVNYLEDYMKGLELEINTIEPYPNRPSIIARKRGKAGKPVLCIYGHLDTVPAGDLSQWKHPPFSGEIHEGRLYGRGSNDIKQGIAASLFAVKSLTELDITLNGDILLCYGAGEETLFPLGLKHIIDSGMIKADFCLYPHGGVPDDPEKPYGITLGHRGNTDITIKTIGKAGHMARKHLSINAIEKMAPIIDGIARMEIKGPHHEIVPPGGTISVNMVKGGIKANIIPPECTIEIDCRFGPGITPSDTITQVKDMIAKLVEKDPDINAEVTTSNSWEASWTDSDHPFVDEIRKVYREFDPKRQILARGGGHYSDSKFFRMVDIPTAMAFAASGSIQKYGGSGHQYNEYVGINEHIESIKMQTSFLVNVLGI
jgi:acetylornithine deacetylase/succinyl-diaminopimelate desuccinylase family protein